MGQIRTTVAFNDEYILQGAKMEATRQNTTLSKYIQELIEKDLQSRLGYRLTCKYENGYTSEERNFYTHNDFMQSVIAYREIFESNEPTTYGNSRLVEYEAWQQEKLIESKKR